MRSPTYGELTFAQIAGKIASYIMGHGLDQMKSADGYAPVDMTSIQSRNPTQRLQSPTKSQNERPARHGIAGLVFFHRL